MQYKLSLQAHHGDLHTPIHVHGKNGKYIELDSIKNFINGYGRAIFYESKIDISKSLKTRSIEDN